MVSYSRHILSHGKKKVFIGGISRMANHPTSGKKHMGTNKTPSKLKKNGQFWTIVGTISQP